MGKPTEIWNGVVTWSSVVQSVQFNQSVVSKSLQPHGTASNEYSGSISFRIDWLDLLAVQETLKSLLQHHMQFQSLLNSLLDKFGQKTWILKLNLFQADLSLIISSNDL